MTQLVGGRYRFVGGQRVLVADQFDQPAGGTAAPPGAPASPAPPAPAEAGATTATTETDPPAEGAGYMED